MEKFHLNIDALKEIQERRMALAIRKSNDYSGQGDNIGLTGAHGLAVRLLDKAMRLYNLTYPGRVQQVKDESIKDTFLDVANYGDFGVSVLEGTWGVRPPDKKRRNPARASAKPKRKRIPAAVADRVRKMSDARKTLPTIRTKKR